MTISARTIFNVSQQFINAVLAESTLDFAEQDLKSFQQTVDISQTRYKAGDMSEADLLKIKLQMLPVPDRRVPGEAGEDSGPGGFAPAHWV